MTRWLLFLLGLASLPFYYGINQLGDRFVYHEDQSLRPIREVLGLFAGASVCYLLALGLVIWKRPRDLEVIALVFLFALVFRQLLLTSKPIQEIDYCRYLWDGRVMVNGHNPFRYAPLDLSDRAVLEEMYTPEDLDRLDELFADRPADEVVRAAHGLLPEDDYDADLLVIRQALWSWNEYHIRRLHEWLSLSDSADRREMLELWELAQAEEGMRTHFDRIHYRYLPTVYPPASQAVFAFSAWVTPIESTFMGHLVRWRVVLMAFDLGILLLLASTLRRLHMPVAWCLAYAWCPLVMKEFTNSAHLDAIAVFFVMLGVRLLVEVSLAVTRSGATAWACAGAAALAVGVLAKNYPVILAPVVGAFLISRIGWRTVLPVALAGAIIVGGYLPFNDGRGHGSLTSLKAFLQGWQTNNLLFRVVHENLRAPGEQPEAWFAVVPADTRQELDDTIRPPLTEWADLRPDHDPTLLLTQLLMGSVLLTIALRLAWTVYRRPTAIGMIRAVTLTMAWGWLLSATGNPWYLTWCLPLLIFLGHRSWFLLPPFALLYYLHFWLAYQDPVREWEFQYNWVWLEFAPFYLAIIAEAIWRRDSRGSAADA